MSIYDDNPSIYPIYTPVTIYEKEPPVKLIQAVQQINNNIVDTVANHNIDPNAHQNLMTGNAGYAEEAGNAQTLQGKTPDDFMPADAQIPGTMTDAEIIAAVKRVDGAGSGLDADTLQGKTPADFLPADTVIPAQLTDEEIMAAMLRKDTDDSGLNANTLQGKTAADFLLFTAYTALDILSKLVGVDGHGSGLDADKLDGKEASEFLLLADALNTIGAYAKTGGVISGDVTITHATAGARSVLQLISKEEGTATDLKMGAGVQKWSITARGSGAENYQLGFYSYQSGQFVMYVRHDGTLVVHDELYAKNSGGVPKKVYHAGNITSGTAAPSGGVDGDIYIQYI